MTDVYKCPYCHADLSGDLIYDSMLRVYKDEKRAAEAAASFGATKTNGKRFSRVIGIYDLAKDRTVSYKCPSCGCEWDANARFHFDGSGTGDKKEQAPEPLEFNGDPVWCYVGATPDDWKSRIMRQVIAKGPSGYFAVGDGDDNRNTTAIVTWKYAWKLPDAG